jgi:hypothetical protein
VIFRALDSDPSKFECCGQLSAAVAAINEKGVLSGHGQHGYGKPYVASAVQTMLGEARASAPAAPLRGNARLLAKVRETRPPMAPTPAGIRSELISAVGLQIAINCNQGRLTTRGGL